MFPGSNVQKLGGTDFSKMTVNPVGGYYTTIMATNTSVDLVSITNSRGGMLVDLQYFNSSSAFGFALVVDGVEKLLYAMSGSLPYHMSIYGAPNPGGTIAAGGTIVGGPIPFQNSLIIRLKNVAGTSQSPTIPYHGIILLN